MSIHLPASVQPLELIWTVIGLAGLCVSVPLLWTFVRDLLLLRRAATLLDAPVPQEDALVYELLGRTYVGVAIGKVLTHATMVAIGVAAMLIHPTASAEAAQRPITPTGLVLTGGLLAIAAISSFIPVLLTFQRRQLRAMLRERGASGVARRRTYGTEAS